MTKISQQYVDELNTIQTDFIWNNEKLKMKHTALVGDGGYRIVDVLAKFSLCKSFG